ncbi:MAG: hypothetical protein HC795_16750 [Coleofasciculaceae cyanobacterium RL_1_1]|nr:hypothetical protein [Coleofasciculaceae cyanobacterium RL_1_1]
MWSYEGKTAANKYNPHLCVLLEDKANRELLNGFIGHLEVNDRAIKKLEISGGWKDVISDFKKHQVSEMRRYPKRYTLMLLDLDLDRENRQIQIAEAVPEFLKDRVFALSSWKDPESLQKALGWKRERIGEVIAEECVRGEQGSSIWQHDLLRHNLREVKRLKKLEFLFLHQSHSGFRSRE